MGCGVQEGHARAAVLAARTGPALHPQKGCWIIFLVLCVLLPGVNIRAKMKVTTVTSIVCYCPITVGRLIIVNFMVNKLLLLYIILVCYTLICNLYKYKFLPKITPYHL